MTAEELFEMPGPGRRELIRGVLHEMEPTGGSHGIVALRAGALLLRYAEQHGGLSYAAETGFLVSRDPDTVRAPDAAYLGPERAVAIGHTSGYLPGAPDLAVEVVSPNDTFSDVQGKAFLWLSSGCQVVLVIDSANRSVTRYRAADGVVKFAAEDVVDCAPAMDGFAPTVAQLFGDEA
jgi:Uma2 family endonuclease